MIKKRLPGFRRPFCIIMAPVVFGSVKSIKPVCCFCSRLSLYLSIIDVFDMAEEPENFLYGINTKQEKAWQYLYAEYYSPLCCYALKILKDREYAMDVVQGIIVRLWEADTYFEDMPSFRGYLYRAVYHNCLKVLRDRNIKELCLPQCGQEEESAGDFGAVIEEEVVRKLRGVIARMPEKRREVMLLCLEEKTVEEIGEILGISVNTVKKHKKEAYQYIRKILSPDIFILFCLLFHPKD